MGHRPAKRHATSATASNATERELSLQGAHESIIAAKVKTKVWLELGDEFMIGDGGLYLLEGIARHGSLAHAVRDIGWSYRHAWGYVRRAERVLGAPTVENRPGRGTARGMGLTATGRLLLERLRALRDRIDDALGPSGPTPAEVAARGRPTRSALASRHARPSKSARSSARGKRAKSG